ncbi:type II toxin-antitoxin system RelB/DinJ family antitoxin [Xanthomonas campestris pv. campestris]|jgi:DNA-damage-inducible protein J|uniref:type II toxin-antitoxin system RelB/DinJ family antitoxin n=1 Tax=Xanthomonas TaxID=338 RepID=UPI000E326B28|nr:MULTISPECIES: type II toxin-antitoxin system RelB/DinJ family antitoxin [Xanthomonas]MDM7672830.1 type II toxin-antitoxin system RelB/DinJ family antitoxin [Xanthomonas campestris pv. campestris]MEA9772244.1 type II toxin-antitoxin system RelB/DinJ family antitoxin [Xanthomonas campestris pv. raphani]MEA9800502.1 type II toxin-antitoxin system RelB/DinJ family antitoxin [Xanthomonas campestris pv. raphani]MEA9833194.1 type II toxin-antitoxin system RelB/DinJ family antitoxin [Xanthomonas cam
MTSAAATETIRARIDPQLKKDASVVLEAMGLSITDAIRMLLVRVAREKALPFEVRVPNATTKAAMLEARKISARFDSKEALFDELEQVNQD